MPSTSLNIVLVIAAAYLAGSIPFSLLIGRWVGKIDLRQHGSGNVGATNVGRLLGLKWGLLALLLDAIKGLLPTGLLPLLFTQYSDRLNIAVACGVAAILGHMFPCWLGFRGGKGVATSLGVVAMLAPWAALAAFISFIAAFAVSRFVSLGSIVAAIVFGTAEMLILRPDPFSRSTWSLAAFSIAVPALVIVRHRSNIARLRRGEERTFTRSFKPKRDKEV